MSKPSLGEITNISGGINRKKIMIGLSLVACVLAGIVIVVFGTEEKQDLPQFEKVEVNSSIPSIDIQKREINFLDKTPSISGQVNQVIEKKGDLPVPNIPEFNPQKLSKISESSSSWNPLTASSDLPSSVPASSSYPPSVPASSSYPPSVPASSSYPPSVPASSYPSQPVIPTFSDFEARSSGINISLSFPGSGSTTSQPPTQQYDPLSYLQQLSQMAGKQTASPISTSKASDYEVANDQKGKSDFVATVSDNIGTTGRKINNQMVARGTFILANLITGINTDLPGNIKAIVSRNIYDTVTGNNLLIPQGSILIAEYNSSVSWGQTRIQVAWKYLILPDGTTIDLQSAPGIDRKGYAGYNANVDAHFLQLSAGTLGDIASSLITNEIAFQSKFIRNPSLTNLMNTSSDKGTSILQDFAKKQLQVQPTLTIQPGSPVNVFVSTDLFLPIQR